MKILHINTQLKGGAAKACLRLHEGLLREGVASKLLTLDETKTEVPEVYSYVDFYSNSLVKATKKIAAKLARKRRQTKLFSFPSASDGFFLVNSPFNITANPLYKEADIIHLHWVNDFLDYPSFFKKNKKPIVWTTHDMTPFTGGYAFEKNFPFEAYEKLTRQQAEIKKQCYENQSITIISPSQWMKEKVAASDLANNFAIQRIPYGLDTEVFTLMNKEDARQKLRLPQDSRIVLFVADSVSVKRKGIDILLEAVRTLYVNNLLLVVVGRQWDVPEKIPPHRYFGEVKSESEMSLIYSAADVFVVPSTEDNFPNTVLESLACGTPVIGFDIGGVNEQIEHKKNGILCPKIEPLALKASILELFKKDEFDRSKISKDAKEKYALKVQAERIKAVYNSILEG